MRKGFYAKRNINPARWHPVVHGVAQKFNGLPAA